MKAYVISVRAIEDNEKEKKNLDKIGGYPTHLPPEGTCGEGDYFLMQIYNDKGIWPYKEGVLCWQFYQDSHGGYIDKIIEVPEGAEFNTDNKIKKRRWLNEYVIEYEEEEEEVDESLSDDEYCDRYYGDDDNDILFRTKVGGFCDRGDRIQLEEDGYEYIALLSNFLCPDMELNLGTDLVTIVKNKSTGKLEIV